MPARPLRVLVVEPDDARFAALAEALGGLPGGAAEAVRAWTEADALAVLRGHPVAACFAPADLGPDLTAQITLALAREGGAYVPVVALAESPEAGLEALTDEGAADYVLRADAARPDVLARALAVARARSEAVRLYRTERDSARAVISAAGAVVCAVDAAGRLASFRVAPRLSHAFPPNARGLAFTALLAPEDRRAAQDLLDQVRLSGRPQTFGQCVAAGGGPLALRWSIAPASAGGLIALALDTADAHREHHRADVLAHVLGLVAEHTPVVCFCLDADGRFLLLRGQGFEDAGPDLVGASIFDVYHGEPRILDNVRRGLGGEGPFTDVVTTREGERYEVTYAPAALSPGERAGLIGVGTRITDAARLGEHLTLIRAALDLTGVPASAADPSGRPLLFNAPMRAFVGGEPEDVEAAGGFPALHADPSVLRPISAAVRGGAPWTGAIMQRSLGGAVVRATLETTPVLDAEGQRIGSVSVVRPQEAEPAPAARPEGA